MLVLCTLALDLVAPVRSWAEQAPAEPEAIAGEGAPTEPQREQELAPELQREEGLAPGSDSDDQAGASGSQPAEEASPDSRGEAVPTPQDLPAGIRDARTLLGRSWAVTYRYRRDVLSDNLSGVRHQSRDEMRARGFRFVSESSLRETHEFGLLYAPHDRVTLSASLPWRRSELRSKDADGRGFEMRTDGLGDLELGGRLRFIRKGRENLTFQLAFGFPTGDFRERDDTPIGDLRVPYDEQPGSGSFYVVPGATYQGEVGGQSWGVQVRGTLYLDDNDEGWRRGDEREVSGWLARRVGDWLSGSVRASWRQRDNPSGRDDQLDPTLRADNDPRRRAGTWIEVGPGVSLAPAFLRGQRLAVEAMFPVYQSLDGPQLETDWRLQAAWLWTF